MDATLHIRLNSNLRNELELLSKDRNIKLSVVIREALETYIETSSIINQTKISVENF